MECEQGSMSVRAISHTFPTRRADILSPSICLRHTPGVVMVLPCKVAIISVSLICLEEKPDTSPVRPATKSAWLRYGLTTGNAQAIVPLVLILSIKPKCCVETPAPQSCSIKKDPYQILVFFVTQSEKKLGCGLCNAAAQFFP